MAQVPTDRGARSRSATRRPRRGSRRETSPAAEATPGAHAPLERGDLIGSRYRLDRRLATGGSAEVWLARDERLDRQVAIKLLQRGLLPDDASRARFAEESRRTAALTHPAIVPVHDVIDDEAHPAIVLRYVEGSTLAEILQRDGPVSVKTVAEIGADLAGALAHAHRAGIVHLDLKPGNVLVDADRHVQLVDFGIARSIGAGAEPDDSSASGPRQVIGTLRYMAPEQLTGGDVDSCTDLFALGLVLHELLTGRPAFTASDPASLVAAQRAGGPAPPPDTPPELGALIGALLAVDPSARPADAADVEARLRAIAVSAADQPVAAAPGSVPTIIPGLPAASAGFAFVAPAAAQDAGLEGDAETVALAAAPTARVDASSAATSQGTGTPPDPSGGSRRSAGRRSRLGRPAALAAAGAALAGGIVLAAAALNPGDNGVASAPSSSPDLGSAPTAPTAKPKVTAAPAPVIRAEPAPPHPKHRGHGKGHD